MSKFTFGLLVLALVAASCSAEAPRFRKANFKNKQFRLFQRQEEAPIETEVESKPAVAPYPPAGITPENPLELPTETQQPAQEYGPPAVEEPAPAQEYGPPAVEEPAPAQEYGPPAAEEPVLVEEVADDEIVVEEQEVVLAEEPQTERLVVYRVPAAARFVRRRPIAARFIQLKH